MYLDQRAAMRDGLKYDGRNHEKAVKRVYTVNNLMIYLAENATKFTPEEMCRDIIPAMLKPRARVEYVKLGGEELTERQDVISLVQTISRSIECKIEVRGAKRRIPKYKSNNNSLSESNSGRDDDGHRDRDRDPASNRDESSRREQNRDRDDPQRSERRQREVSSNESRKSNASSMGSAFVSFSQAHDSVGSQDSDELSSQYSYSTVSCRSKVF